ncbi:MAG: hypothetical protein LW852_03985 [Sediminibacterium sp.]|nr:hypothetical protein [Sediminibacterium sp.]
MKQIIVYILGILTFQSTLAQENVISPAPSGGNSYYQPLIWRNAGPMRGGRSVTATGVPGNNQIYYMGTTGGGVWKTEDAGLNWKNISDGYFKTGSVGAVAVAPSDANVVYVGMGEHAPRGVMTSYGDGVYRSTDAGKTWKHLGLELTRHIANIRIHPNNPDVAYVAAQGPLHGSSPDRGVFRTENGGKSWKRLLYIDENTGCVDLAIDPTNPRILYAAMWEHRRLPWKVISGGKGSGLYKSKDGGDTWEKIQEGLPKELGKMSINLAGGNPEKLYLIVESDTEKEQGGLFVSNDAGGHWNRVSKDHRLVQRAWYYIEAATDPKDPNTIYVLNSPAIKSIDGGRTWESFRAPHGDYHQLWINPDNPKNMIVANDGGASISFNGGQSWSSQDNQPTAQFYRINADNLFPYNLYAGQQDNTSVKLASMGSSWGGRISERDWSYSAGGESAFLAFDPDQPDHVMGGSYQGTIGLLMTKINEQHNIMEYPVQYQALDPKDMTYRFNWNAPIIHSLHQKGVFYHAGNRLFKTSNLGKSWEVISPDLTTHDTTKMGKSGGPYTNEGAGGENYCTITYVAESPHENGVMYTGSDDGMVYITRNGGKDWTNISPEGIRGNQVNAIEVSPHSKGTVYLAVHRYKLNDFTPFIYKSTDYGTTWTKIQTGIPYGAYVRVVREDNEVKDLLYAGTETGFYISYNGGRNWQQLQLNLPVTPITDLKLHQDHLLASTQGRAFWILDDLTPLRKNAATIKDSFALLSVKDAYRLSAGSPLNQLFPGDKEPRTINTTMANPVTGAQFFFHILGKETVKSATIEILDAAGNNIRTYYMQKPVNRQGNNQLQDDPAIEVRNGLNRFVWDLCHRNLPTIDNVLIEGSDKGRMVVPGNYTVRLTINGKSQSQNFKVLTDPRQLKEYPSLVTAEAYQEQEKLLQLLSNDVEEIHVAVTQMHKLQQQLKELRERTEDNSTFDTLYRHAGSILEKIQDWEAQLIQRKSQTNDDVINFVNKLSANIIFVKGEAEGNVPYITEGHIKRTQDLHAEWLKYRNQQQALLQGDIRILNENCRKLNWNVISF